MGFLRTAWGWLRSNTWAIFLAVVGVLSALLGIERWRRKRESRRRQAAESRADAAEDRAESAENVAELGRERERGDDAAEDVHRLESEAIKVRERTDAEAHAAELERIERAEDTGGDLADLANARFGNPEE